MNYWDKISKYHRGPVKVSKIDELVKSSNIAVICGSGSSLNSLSRKIPLGDCDLIGTASLVLYKIKPRWVFWESLPIFDLEPEPLYGTYDYAVADAIFYDRLRDVCIDRSINELIINPFMPSRVLDSNHGYMSPLGEEVTQLYLPYFFVGGANMSDMLRDLRIFRETKCNILLNFRCSVVRMISLAVALGYKRIFISGIDSSSPSYWYTDPESETCADLSNAMSEILEIKAKSIGSGASGRIMHEGEGYGDGINMHESIWFAIPYIVSRAIHAGISKPRITYLGTDRLALQCIKTFCDKYVDVG